MNKGRSKYYITKSMTHNYDDKITGVQVQQNTQMNETFLH